MLSSWPIYSQNYAGINFRLSPNCVKDAQTANQDLVVDLTTDKATG